MKIYALILELHLSQNFCQAHLEVQTKEHAHVLQKYKNYTQEFSQNVKIPQN